MTTPDELVAEVDAAANALKALALPDDDGIYKPPSNEEADAAAAHAIRGFAALGQLAARALAART